MTWREGRRCPNAATVWLVTPDGRDCPGGAKCDECAEAVIEEYERVLGETWTARPLTEVERM